MCLHGDSGLLFGNMSDRVRLVSHDARIVQQANGLRRILEAVRFREAVVARTVAQDRTLF
jgi:hypothetical protein